jgi:hypothetical protein
VRLNLVWNWIPACRASPAGMQDAIDSRLLARKQRPTWCGCRGSTSTFRDSRHFNLNSGAFYSRAARNAFWSNECNFASSHRIERAAMNRQLLYNGLSLPAALRVCIVRVAEARALPRGVRLSSSMPIVEASFWRSLIPKPLRRSNKPDDKKPRSKEWNPATFFIVIFVLIGSMSINLISVKQDYAAFMRQSDARIGLLREVVEKLQRGEKVDVERVLGAGDAEKELEWEDGTHAAAKHNPGIG